MNPSALTPLPCYLNREHPRLPEARIGVTDRGFTRGDGTCEVIPVVGERQTASRTIANFDQSTLGGASVRHREQWDRPGALHAPNYQTRQSAKKGMPP